MASVLEKVKNGKIVSFKFRTCLGRDEHGKQIIKCCTWYPEEGLTKAKSRKAAAAAAVWEKESKEAYLIEQAEKEKQALEAMEKAEILTFGRFVREVWLPLAVNDGEHRPSTVAMYTHILNVILPHFEDTPLHEVTGLQIITFETNYKIRALSQRE